ncbi:MAG TPA: ATP-binding cassette domain-containing protein [Anaerolineae bacterium]|nr:ATP-binding cassette domain-containing protein [Anaerolineae bacterium]
MAIIELENVTFTYRGAKVPALRNFSLSVEEGEFVGIIGSTGAGKTTLCWCITGVIPHILRGRLEGTITVKGFDTRQKTVAEIAQIVGLVQQDAECQLLMTDVEKEITFPLENLAIPREEIHRRLNHVLDVVNLRMHRQRHPFYLSGGQKQRVAVAAVLAMEPEVLILDEATSELDPVGAEEVLDLVRKLKARGQTVIMVEHNMDELAKYADRIVVLKEGEKVRDGPAREILSDVDFLTGMGIYPPQIAQVAAGLVVRGIPVQPLPITLEEGRHAFAALVGGS